MVWSAILVVEGERRPTSIETGRYKLARNGQNHYHIRNNLGATLEANLGELNNEALDRSERGCAHYCRRIRMWGGHVRDIEVHLDPRHG